MEKLITTLITLTILGSLMKVGLFYLNLKVKTSKPLSAEQVIKCGHMHPALHKQMLKDMIIDRSRDIEIEEAYKELRDIFKSKLQSKQLTRGQILGVEEYLRNQLDIKIKFNNNAHAIYSMLKSQALTKEHISTIKKFIA